MIKVLKKNFRFNRFSSPLLSLFVVYVGIGFSSYSESATLNGRLSGESVIWLNAVNYQGGDYIKLTNFQSVPTLQSTSEWVPGTFVSNPTDTLVLSSENGESVTIDFQVAGLEYLINNSFSAGGSPPSGYPTCGNTEDSGTSYSIIGSSCVAPTSYIASNGDSYDPFQTIRPIMQADKDAIAQAFQDAAVGSGQFTGTTTVNPAYLYRSQSSTWTYRQALSVPLTVRIIYEASSLTGIEVVGNGIMEPEYDTLNHTVSGSTDFDITATGYFSEGITLTFDGDSDGEFQLKHETEDKQIPYSIKCGQCEIPDIVSNGTLMSGGETKIAGEGEEIKFDFTVSYDNATADLVETGNYTDTFRVYFEEDI